MLAFVPTHPLGIPTMEPDELSIAFAEAFCNADIDRLESLLAPDFRLHGPLFSFASRDEYLASLRASPPEAGECAVLAVHTSDDGAAVLYQYRKLRGAITIAQFNEVRDGVIHTARLVFDPARVRPG